MAAHPDVFSKQEIKDRGVWSSQAYKKYIRSHGQSRQATHEKILALIL